MLRQLSNLALAFSLVAGGWGYALAAVLCGHPECVTPASSAGHGAHGPQAASEPAGHGAHDEHAKSVAAEHTGRGSSASGHCGQEPADAGAAADQNQLSSTSRASVSASGVAPCGHCVQDAAPRDAADSVRQAERPQRPSVVYDQPRARLHAPSETGFVRDIIPSRGAPPGRVSAHVLNSVFRI